MSFKSHEDRLIKGPELFSSTVIYLGKKTCEMFHTACTKERVSFPVNNKQIKFKTSIHKHYFAHKISVMLKLAQDLVQIQCH